MHQSEIDFNKEVIKLGNLFRKLLMATCGYNAICVAFASPLGPLMSVLWCRCLFVWEMN